MFTVAMLLDSYLARMRDMGMKTRPAETQAAKVIRRLGSVEVSTLTPLVFEAYRSERLKDRTKRGGPPAHGTINRELGLLRAAMNRAVRYGELPQAPYVPMVKEPPPRWVFFTEEEFRARAPYGRGPGRGRPGGGPPPP